MKQLVESIGRYLLAVTSPLIKHPEAAELRVASSPAGDLVRFRLILKQSDVARVIGRNGMTASAIRSLAKAAGEKMGIKVVVHILSDEEVAESAVRGDTSAIAPATADEPAAPSDISSAADAPAIS